VDNESFTNKAGFEFITTEGDMAESEMAHTWNRADKIYDFSLEKKLFGREVCGCTVNVQGNFDLKLECGGEKIEDTLTFVGSINLTGAGDKWNVGAKVANVD